MSSDHEWAMAEVLGVEEQYGSPWDGLMPSAAIEGQRNAAHVDAAEALFGDIVGRFRISQGDS